MSDGRLDDAYEQAIRTDVRDHRRGQRLISRLTRAYESRVQDHLNAGNPRAALVDADRAMRLGGNQPNIVALRDEACSLMTADQNAKQARHQKIAAAKRCIASGDFSMGAKICQEVDEHGNTVVGLMHDAEINRKLVEAALDRGRKALKASQWEAALDSLDEMKRLQPTHPEVNGLVNDVARSIVRHIRTAFAKGRLDHAEMLLERIQRYAPDSLEVEELARAIGQCRDAAAATKAAELSTAIERLKSLKRIVPEARWLDGAVKDAETVARCIESLRTGPLGALHFQTAASTETVAPKRPRSNPPMRVFEATPVIPENFLVHLDGAGSFLVVRGSRVSIGPQSRSRPADVQLLGQMGIPAMAIERLDEDYFLTSDAPVLVNGKRTANTLLTSQNQVRLGRRGSMHFALPNSASTSATLDFVGLRLVGGNTKRVILMDDAIVVGPQPSAHIQSLSMERSMVIHFRNGELRIRPLSRTTETQGSVLALDRPHDLDGLSLVITNASGLV